MRLSISIVNWNTTELLRNCLRAIYNNPPQEAPEIIVVDNASSDFDEAALQAEFPQVKIIANTENTGYAHGNNQAIKAGSGEYILLLNPDTEVQPGALQALLDFMDAHPEAAAAGAKLIRPDGSIDQCVRGFPTPLALMSEYFGLAKMFPICRLLGGYRMTWFQYDRVQEVDQVMGSCMMISRAVLEQIKGFDERFHIFFNEVDWCFRAKRAGFKVFFVPFAHVLHLGGQSTKQVRSEMRLESQRSLIDFYRKHYRGRFTSPMYLLAMFGIWLNMKLIHRQGKELRD